MAASAVSYRHFALGLLAQQPMSGYDINRSLKSLSWLIGTPSFGSLYPALHELLDEGLVVVQVTAGQSRPPRKVYSITPAGRQVLQEWIDRPPVSSTPLKDFVMRLILSANYPDAALAERLRRRRAQVARYVEDLTRLAQGTGGDAQVGLSLAFDYGLALATAELAWLDGILMRLSAVKGAGSWPELQGLAG